jgi:hypothetical protein
MSESITEFEVTFADADTASSIYNIFSTYNYDVSKETQFKKEIEALSTLGLDGSIAFNDDNDAYELRHLRLDGPKLEFTVWPGSWFPINVFELLSGIPSIEILMVMDDDSTGDVYVEYVKGDHTVKYCTGGGSECDAELFESKFEPDVLKIVKNLIISGKLVTIEYEEEDEY